ncbi:uncharacterized protein PAN0_010c3963 [Moesziomyces antarcticus]|uniref:Uncharacterized protein n=2 Tax=Pseudozyma antarctica TaxID=84753 RepID=A0A081CGE7_PSEA2|nr:uncharacterized protein PAN0_010c3963 [Moesziomyces antarcticus]GAK65743.1 hypothetical protein PAN0_010c3963 [Moesziomyces antarcticus]SPO45369.1 uncharacterized protein PSANT_03055 [Moesziomyces antarcticus]
MEAGAVGRGEQAIWGNWRPVSPCASFANGTVSDGRSQSQSKRPPPDSTPSRMMQRQARHGRPTQLHLLDCPWSASSVLENGPGQLGALAAVLLAQSSQVEKALRRRLALRCATIGISTAFLLAWQQQPAAASSSKQQQAAVNACRSEQHPSSLLFPREMPPAPRSLLAGDGSPHLADSHAHLGVTASQGAPRLLAWDPLYPPRLVVPASFFRQQDVEIRPQHRALLLHLLML